MRRIAVTDKPSVGKSTVVAKAAGKMADKFGLKIRGIRTSEIHKEGRKEGRKKERFFNRRPCNRKDLYPELHQRERTEGWEIPREPEYLARIGAGTLRNYLDCCQMVIDEIGTMELKSEEFKSG